MFSYIYICIQNIVKYINNIFYINPQNYYFKKINYKNIDDFKYAIINDDKESIKYLIKSGCHKNNYYNNESLILNYAIDNEKWNMTEIILDELGTYNPTRKE